MKKYKLLNLIKLLAQSVIILLLVLLIVILLFAPQLITHDPYLSHAANNLRPPDSEYLLGCDHLGRDLYSRIIMGVQSSLVMTLIGVGINFIIGMALGVIAGYFENWFSAVIMRLADMMLGFPGLVLSIAVVGVLGPGPGNTLFALTVSGWAEFSRMARALTLAEKKNEYMHTAVLNGNNDFQIILRYIGPAITSQMLILACLSIGTFVLRFSSLAFLGLGFQPPRPELGLILSEAKNYMQLAPFYMIYPGLALFVIVFTFNFLADILRDHLDVHQKVKQGRRKLKSACIESEGFDS